MPEEYKSLADFVEHIRAVMEYEETREGCLECLDAILGELLDTSDGLTVTLQRATSMENVPIGPEEAVESIDLHLRSHGTRTRQLGPINVTPGDTLAITWNLNFTHEVNENDNLHRTGSEDWTEEDLLA